MRQPRPPVFLARRSYRLRRLTDAARLLPVLGVVLVLLPVLWRPADTPQGDTAAGWVYLFAVWAVLILAAFGLSRFLMPSSGGPDAAADAAADAEVGDRSRDSGGDA